MWCHVSFCVARIKFCWLLQKLRVCVFGLMVIMNRTAAGVIPDTMWSVCLFIQLCVLTGNPFRVSLLEFHWIRLRLEFRLELENSDRMSESCRYRHIRPGSSESTLFFFTHMAHMLMQFDLFLKANNPVIMISIFCNI